MKKNQTIKESRFSSISQKRIMMCFLVASSIFLFVVNVQMQLKAGELSKQIAKLESENKISTVNKFDCDKEIADKSQSSFKDSFDAQSVLHHPHVDESEESNSRTLNSGQDDEALPVQYEMDHQHILAVANAVLNDRHKITIEQSTSPVEVSKALTNQANDSLLSITDRLDALEALGEVNHNDLSDETLYEMLDTVIISDSSEDQIDLLDTMKGFVTSQHIHSLMSLSKSENGTVRNLALSRLSEASDNEAVYHFLVETMQSNPDDIVDFITISSL